MPHLTQRIARRYLFSTTLDGLLNKSKRLTFEPIDWDTWEAMQWDGIPEDYNRTEPEDWEQARLPLSDDFEERLREFEGTAVNLIAELDYQLKDLPSLIMTPVL